MSTSSKGIVLFGHGARNPDWARPMERAQAQLSERWPEYLVELGFLEFMTPDLVQAIDRLAERGARQITVVPMFLAQGGHVKKDVPELLATAREKHADCDIRLVQAVGEADSVLEAMAAYAVDAAQ